MKMLINLAILFGFPGLMLQSSQNSGNDEPGHYCNARYNFCADYPHDLLSREAKSDNDDGIILKTADGTAQVMIGGSYNVLDWTPRELYEFTISDFPEKGKDVKVIHSFFSEDYYECHFIHGNTAYFHKALFTSDSYIQLIESAPIDKTTLMTRLMEEVSLNFQS